MAKKKYDIDIDGYIGSWFSSKRYIKNIMSELGDNTVLVRVNSLGGNYDDAIDIAAQFEAHGNVTCEMFALNASSATIFPLGAKYTRIHETASYLIHKVLTWVDKWGYMNEDDLDAVIEELKVQKDNSATLTLNIAKMYAKKSGKPIKDILNLMKEERWLSAQEAKDWGFVDEVFSDTSVKAADIDEQQIQLINAAGLPVPERKQTKPDEAQSKNIVNEIVSGLRDIFNPTNKITTEMKKDFLSVNTILNVEGIEFKNGKAELTEDQVKVLNDTIDAANAAKKTAEDKVTEKDTEIQNLKTQVENLNKGAGADTTTVPKETDTPSNESNEVDVNAVRNLFDALPD